MMKSSQSEEELGRASPVLWPYRRHRGVEQVGALAFFFFLLGLQPNISSELV